MMTQKSLNELKIEQVESALEDERDNPGSPLKGINLRDLAIRIVEEQVEGKDAITVRAIQLVTAPSITEKPVADGSVVALALKGGKVGKPDSISEAIWRKLTAQERHRIANEVLAGEGPTLPKDIAERPDPNAAKKKRQPEFEGGRFIYSMLTNTIPEASEAKPIVTPTPTPQQRLATHYAQLEALKQKK